MNVKELIEKLQEFPPDAFVIVDYKDESELDITNIIYNHGELIVKCHDLPPL